MNILIATIKSWNIENAKKFKTRYGSSHNIHIIDSKDGLTLDTLEKIKPNYIFFPHWSYIIPADIYENYSCVVFHMTDLPFGRGGSPLQNLIARGFKETKVSAIKVTKEIDAGPVYLKEPLSLSGSAEQIFKRCSDIVFENMIPKFLETELIPKEQQGEIVTFPRRKPEESQLNEQMSPETIYDYIRMLDAEGYPKAYMDFGKYRLCFSNAAKDGKKIIAQAEIFEKDNS